MIAMFYFMYKRERENMVYRQIGKVISRMNALLFG